MARYLVLDWDSHRLHLLAASVKHGQCHIERLLTWDTPEGADAAVVGQFLAVRLKSEKIKPGQVLACIGRDSIIIKEIRFPSVPLPEEPAVVRFQAQKELTNPAEEVVIDYLRLVETGQGGEQRALAMTVRRDVVAKYQKICQTAGLKLAALTPRAIGVAACLSQVASAAPAAPSGPLAVLTQNQHWAEFCVVQDNTLLFARALAAAGRTEDAALLGEIRRNLAVFANQASGLAVQGLFLAGHNGGGLRDRLQDALAIPVLDLEPFAGLSVPEPDAGHKGAFAGMIGLVRAMATGSTLPVDFIHAKEPRPPRDPNRNRLIAGITVAAACLIAGVVFCYFQIASRDKQLEALILKKLDLDRQLAPIEEDGKRVAIVGEWTGSEVVWLDELYDLTDRFPDLNAMRVTHLTADPLARTGKKKNVSKMVIKGVTTSDYRALDTLMARLVEDGQYRVEPPVLARNPGPRSMFIQQFTTRIDVTPRLPTNYVRRLSPMPLGGFNQGQPDGNDMGFGFDGFEGGRP